MLPARRFFTAVGVFMLFAVAMTAASATGARLRAESRPVIGVPVTVPAKAVAGRWFSVSFGVTRSDTGSRLTRGRMICDPSVSGKVLWHLESFRAGKARLAFVIPARAQGKLLKVKVTIRTPAGVSATRVARFRVLAPPEPALSIAAASVPEGNSGTTTLSFPVTLSGPSTQPVSVAYATSDGTATAPRDYAAASGTVTFRPGEIAKTVPVSVAGDREVEQDETLSVTLSSPVHATIARAVATGTITNDDIAARSGHYTGTTSQGHAIAFDASSDLMSLANVAVTVDLTCAELPVSIQGVQLASSAWFPIAPDWSFATSFEVTFADAPVTVPFTGRLVAPGSASGTLRLDGATRDAELGTIHCSTGNVTWTASWQPT
jgi:hypothetical protein